jgi:hypothetical protein
MPDESCDCCSGRENPTVRDERAPNSAGALDRDSAGSPDRILTDTPVLHADLPGELQAALGEFLGVDRVGTLAEWAVEVRRRTAGRAIDVDDLCHATGETEHWGRVDGETHYFQCFYDAVVLAALADGRVDVRTVSPGGTVVEATARGTAELSVAPVDAVFSFGIADSADVPAGDDPTAADVYAAVCPYVRAFPDAAAYVEWAETVPAATVAMPLDGATELAEALVH